MWNQSHSPNIALSTRILMDVLMNLAMDTTTRINMDTLRSVSPTLLTLLRQISSKLDDTAASALIGNVVTSIVSNQPTSTSVFSNFGKHQ